MVLIPLTLRKCPFDPRKWKALIGKKYRAASLATLIVTATFCLLLPFTDRGSKQLWKMVVSPFQHNDNSMKLAPTDKEKPTPECLQQRMESGELASFPQIVSWTKRWVSLINIDENIPESSLKPCVNDSAMTCVDNNCRNYLPWSVEDRLAHNRLFHQEMMLTMTNIARIQCFGFEAPAIYDVIIVTAVGPHTQDIEVWLEHTFEVIVPEIQQQVNKTVLVVVVNLRMYPKQLTQISMWETKIIRFPDWSFPAHISLNSSILRPIIIRAFLPRARHSLIYTDPDVFIRNSQVKTLFDKVEVSGVLFAAPTSTPFPVHTSIEMFKHFSVDPCAFFPFPEIWSSFGIYRNISYISRVLVEPWVACTLSLKCVCPTCLYPFDQPVCIDDINNNTVGRCHKLSQSVLNILLATIFRWKLPGVTLNKDQIYVQLGETDPFTKTNQMNR